MSLKVFCLSIAYPALQGQQAGKHCIVTSVSDIQRKSASGRCFLYLTHADRIAEAWSVILRKEDLWQKDTLFAQPAFLIMALWLLLVFAFRAH